MNVRAFTSTLFGHADELNRIAVFFCCGALRRYWHKADMPRLTASARFRG